MRRSCPAHGKQVKRWREISSLPPSWQQLPHQQRSQILRDLGKFTGIPNNVYFAPGKLGVAVLEYHILRIVCLIQIRLQADPWFSFCSGFGI